MLLFIGSIVLFNLLAYTTCKRLNRNELTHIWLFTIAFQLMFDIIIDFKFKGYWYFSKASLDWAALLARAILIPPVNMLFLNFYPFKRAIGSKLVYIAGWTIIILGYELLTLMPGPWGYFHYDWWNIGYSAILDPILFLILLAYFKWVRFIQPK